MKTKRLTVAQATIKFLKNQFSKRDNIELPFFAGCFGLFFNPIWSFFDAFSLCRAAGAVNVSLN